MNLSCDELQQLTALEAVGALEGEDALRLRYRLETDAAAREELRRFLNVAAALGATAPMRQPPASVRARVLERISKQRQAPREDGIASSGGKPVVREGFDLVLHTAPWIPAPLPGMRFKVLSAGSNQTYVMLEVELAPGASYPEHSHVGVEDMYVLTGDLQTEGLKLGPGDTFHAEPGTDHDGLRTVWGCTALMVVSKAAFEATVPS